MLASVFGSTLTGSAAGYKVSSTDMAVCQYTRRVQDRASACKPKKNKRYKGVIVLSCAHVFFFVVCAIDTESLWIFLSLSASKANYLTSAQFHTMPQTAGAIR